MLLELLVTVIIVGLLAWLVSAFPIPEPFKRAAYVILLIVLVLYLASLFGVAPGLRRLG